MEKKNIELDDFIDENLMEKPVRKIDPQAKLINFSNIKVSAIDPQIKQDLADLVSNVKASVAKIKALMSEKK